MLTIDDLIMTIPNSVTLNLVARDARGSVIASDMVEVPTAALLGMPAPDAWQPIWTAPEIDHLTALVFVPGRGICIGSRDFLAGGEYRGTGWHSGPETIAPTHWMPLPTIPAA